MLGRPAIWDTERPCVQCGAMVETTRRCYAIPHCYRCLPPPTPIARIHMKTKSKDRISLQDGRIMTLSEALDSGILSLKQNRYYYPPRFFATDGNESWEIGETLYRSRMKQPLGFGEPEEE